MKSIDLSSELQKVSGGTTMTTEAIGEDGGERVVTTLMYPPEAENAAGRGAAGAKKSGAAQAPLGKF